MNFLEEFQDIMKSQQEIALATSVSDVPNVRIVNFVYLEEIPWVVYFASFKDNDKIKEYSDNPRVSFTTIPHDEMRHIRVSKATVQRSNKTIFDLQDAFVNKIPWYDETISFWWEDLWLYEIHFEEVKVIVDISQEGVVQV